MFKTILKGRETFFIVVLFLLFQTGFFSLVNIY